jgi:hypothetical protein
MIPCKRGKGNRVPEHDPIPPQGAAREPIANPHAWARFRRIMAWMAGTGALCAGLAIAWLHWSGVTLRLHMVIATVLGVFFTVLVGTGLMTLSFLSSGSGHDEEAAKPPER